MLLSLAVVPVVGFACDDLSAAPMAKHHHTERPSHRTWRTVPGTLTAEADAPSLVPSERLTVLDPALAVPLLVHVPFVPPRG